MVSYGRKAEDGIIPVQYHLKETQAPCEESIDPDAIYKKRTELNAKDSDGTLIITKGSPIGGTLYTIKMAKKHKKPYFILNILENPDIIDVVHWIKTNNIHKLNVAGPRASQTNGVYEFAYNILRQLFETI